MATLSFPCGTVDAESASLVVGAEPGASNEGGTRDSHVVTGREVRLTLPEQALSYYRHGWQSWSLACWHDADAVTPVPKPVILHPLQVDPLHARRTDPNGSWVGAVRFTGGRALLLGALGTDAHVELDGDILRGFVEAGVPGTEWLVAYGEEREAFRLYAEALGDRLGRAPAAIPAAARGTASPRVWCSWYSLYTGITQEAIAAVVAGFEDMPFDVIQIDDGWQVEVGDWRANQKFPGGMEALAGRIRATGRRAGLWLAPLIANAGSRVAREHPDWLLRDRRGKPVSAGFNWGGPLYALDTTVPAALDWLVELMKTVRSWGYDYLKLDFLYGGALPGERHSGAPREAAYRDALRVLREAMGDAFFVACGAPIVPSLGLCDALRVGPDVAGFWESGRNEKLLTNPAIPGTRTAIRTTFNRLWLKSIVACDPDVVYVSEEGNDMTPGERALLQALAQVCGFVATSDLPVMTASERAHLHDLLTATPVVRPAGSTACEIDGEITDFGPALDPPVKPRGFATLLAMLVGWVGSRRVALRILESMEGRDADRGVRRFVSRCRDA